MSGLPADLVTLTGSSYSNRGKVRSQEIYKDVVNKSTIFDSWRITSFSLNNV